MRVNGQIRARSVRVVDNDGGQLGILEINRAIEAAEARGMDLVEVAPNATPPVCRIMDFGKYKYMQKKKSQEAKKKQQTITVKEIKLRPQTDKHDLETKIRHVRRFIGEGDKVKFNVFFRGREIAHPELGINILKRVADAVKDIAKVESPAAMEGRRMIMVIAPSTDGAAKPAPKKPAPKAEKKSDEKKKTSAKADSTEKEAEKETVTKKVVKKTTKKTAKKTATKKTTKKTTVKKADTEKE